MRIGKGPTIRGVVLTDQSLTIAGHDGFVRRWDTETKEQTWRAAHMGTGNVYACACTVGGDRIASGGDDGILKIWIVGRRLFISTLQLLTH